MACSFLNDLEAGDLRLPISISSKWNYLDQDEFRSKMVHGESPFGNKIYLLQIEGLTCASCTQLLERLPDIDDRVYSSRLSFINEKMKIEISNQMPLSEVAKLINSLGYKPHFIRKGEEVVDHADLAMTKLVKRIAVAGFCLGNIMLLAIAGYAGIDGNLKTIFSFTQIALFFPILLYSASPFYQGAMVSLKRRSIHLDLVISISLVLSFVLSLFAFFIWNKEMYLDSLSAFTFLILVSRWTVKKFEQKAKKSLSDKLFHSDQPVKTMINGRESILPLAHVKEGDFLIFEKDQILLCDGKLVSNRTALDCSLINGESVPRVYTEGMSLAAGMRPIGGSCTIQVTRKFDQTDLYTSLKSSEDYFLGRSKNLENLDRIGQIILGLALLIALVSFPTFTFALELPVSEAWSRILSLLVITCPCALAFGGPLSYAFALQQARKKSILVSSADAFDRVNTTKNIVFDKTGTLTTGLLKLKRTSPSVLPRWQKELVLALESSSQHPIAFALRDAYKDIQGPLPILNDLTEVVGEKVFGILNGTLYSIKRTPQDESSELKVSLFENDIEKVQFYFEDQLRKESKELLRELKLKYNLSICSGDRIKRVHKLASSLLISKKNAHGELSPTDKLNFIEKNPYSMMLGDGFNDSAALMRAHVGIAVEGPLSQSLKKADICFLKPGLNSLKELLSINHTLQKNLRVNLGFTIAYNFIAINLCLFGRISPLVAAILMPLSSIFVLSQSKRGFS